MSRRAVAAVVLAGLALGCVATTSGAAVYWGTRAGSLGRANLDGTGVTANLLTPRELSNVCGVAVDRNWIYFAERPGNGVGRATLDGTLLFESFISGLTNPCGVAVDGQHVYWADTHFSDGMGSIGRANLDGSGRNDSFVTGLNQPCAVAVDAAHVYWSSCGTNDAFGTGNTIGRANLDGSGANDAFISGASGAAGVAVDASHIYWSNNSLGTIGRADLNGANVNQSFIEASPGPAADPGAPSTLGVAVGGGRLFWDEGESLPMDNWGSFIGRATVAGGDLEQNLIVADSVARGVAVDAFTPSTTAVAVSPDRVIYGQDVELRAHVGAVSPPAGVPPQPTGAVAFKFDDFFGPVVGAPVAIDGAGDARLEPPFPVDAGIHFARAAYAGDANYATSHALTQLAVDPASTQTAMKIAPNPATIGSTFDVTVSVQNTSTAVVPFGSIDFFVAGEGLGSVDLDANGEVKAAITTEAGAVAPGQYQLIAHYRDTTGTPEDFLPSSAQATLTLSSPPSPAAPVAGPTPTPPSVFTLRTPKVKRGRITLTVVAPRAGLFSARATTRRGFVARASGLTLRADAPTCAVRRARACVAVAKPARYGSARARTQRAGPLTFVIRPVPRARAALERGTTLHLKLAVTFKPDKGGAPSTVTRRVTVRGTKQRRT